MKKNEESTLAKMFEGYENVPYPFTRNPKGERVGRELIQPTINVNMYLTEQVRSVVGAWRWTNAPCQLCKWVF